MRAPVRMWGRMWPRSRLPVGASALCALLLCWLYLNPGERGPRAEDIVRDLRKPGPGWRGNRTAAEAFRKELQDCCDAGNLFSMTKVNTPVGKRVWFDGEFLYSLTINNATHSLLPQDTPFKQPLKKCSVVGNGGILRDSGCGKQIDEADFVVRCNLPPLTSEYTSDVGSKTHLVTINPSIIDQRFQNLLWSRKAFVESVKVYGSGYLYMPAFSMIHGTEPSLRVYYTVSDFRTNQTVLFANPNFLRNVGKFWRNKGVRSKRLSTGLFMASAALGLCDEVTIYGFWPFQTDLNGKSISHHYYDDILPLSGFHAMPEEFSQLWLLHKTGILRVQLDRCA